MAEGPTLASLDAGMESPADTMRSILKDMEGEEAFRSDAPVTSDTAAKPDTAAATAAPEDKVDRGDGRNAKGQWVGKGPEPGTEAKPNTETGEKSEKAASKPEDGKEPVEAAVETDDLDPPHDWPLERQNEFRKLPANLKTFVLDADKSGREAATANGRLQAFESIFAPRRQAWAMQGMTDDVAAIKALLAYSDYVDQHPAEFIQQLMQAKGLQFDTGTQTPPNGNGNGHGQPDPNDPDYDDPVIKKIMADNAALRGELNQIKQGLQGQTQAQRQHEISQAQSALAAFQNEKDERGRLKHPYMTDQNIRSLMSAMLRSGRASDHVQAYDMACRADPEVSAKIAAATKAAEEQARAVEQRKKAEAAQRAGTSVSGSPAAPVAAELSGRDAREDMRQMAAQMGFRLGG